VSLTAAFAEFVSGPEPGRLPPSASRAARRSVVNSLAASVGAFDHPAVRIACHTCQEWGGAPQARVLGRGVRVSAPDAAWVNGILAHVLDFDDTHLATIIHVSAPVLPAVLALADERGSAGSDVVAAFAAGAEVALRLGLAVFPSHYDAGHHISATVGAVGAAAGAARLLGLDPARARNALGIATTGAGGLRVMFGSMTKSLHIGNAARAGVVAARLAARGFTAAADSLEGRAGFLSTLCPSPAPERALEGLGSRWVLEENTFKPFPCGIVAHPVCDGALRLRGRVGDWREIERVELEVHPRALELTGNPAPADGLESKFSIHHCAAAGLALGALGEEQFGDRAVRDPRVLDLRARVTAREGRGLGEDQARLTLFLRDGRRLQEDVEHCLGSAGRPMEEAEIEAKFRAQAPASWGGGRVDRLLRRLWAIEGEPDVRPVLDLMDPAS
jgi:2-methylcitrate dehydratase PrpD